jgi:hypothetical protein
MTARIDSLSAESNPTRYRQSHGLIVITPRLYRAREHVGRRIRQEPCPGQNDVHLIDLATTSVDAPHARHSTLCEAIDREAGEKVLLALFGLVAIVLG